MNKNEIARQFARQTLQQEPQEQAINSQQQEPTANNPTEPAELTEAKRLLSEIRLLHQAAQESYKSSFATREVVSAQQLRELKIQSIELTRQAKQAMQQAEEISEYSQRIQKGALLRLYLNVVLSAICSALFTMLVIWLIYKH